MGNAEYVLVGALIGVLSGLFGVGGSSVSTPVLRLVLGVSPLIALATPLPVTLPAAVAGGYVYHRRGFVRWRVVWTCSAFGVPSVIVGALATAVVHGSVLLVLTGAFVALVGGRLLVAPDHAAAQHPHEHGIERSAIIGVVVGFFSGLLANGGGFLLVPAFIVLMGMTVREAAATSLITVVAFAIPGTAVHWWLGHIDVRLMLWLSVGVLPSAYVGSRIGVVLNPTVGRLTFGAFLVVFGLFFLIREALTL
ncbi:MAG: sulfite exporter TauE/SafE family protein [Dehalococcoidia bacterium]